MLKNNKLTIENLPKEIPDFKNSKTSKERLIEEWLIRWIEKSLKEEAIHRGDILPKKCEIASYLGISIGTVQNAIRYTEDKGYLQSKQRTGTLISGYNPYVIKKQTSKREAAIYKIKKIIVANGINSIMPAASVIAKKISLSTNTVRLAYLNLCDNGYLQYTKSPSGRKILKVVEVPDISNESNIAHISLVEKTIKDISDYITNNLKVGDKLISRIELAKMFDVSIKTVHDALNAMEVKGVIQSKRGRYGTTIEKMPNDTELFQPLKERSIFARADEVAFYRWEKIKREIIRMIKEDFHPGMKLPSMDELSKKFNVSTNTIRKALKTLASNGYIDFQRGRYGGTFVLDLPEQEKQQSYEWLAVTTDFVPFNSGN
jgi:DNA-binding GntR family transcriptional regulator